MARSIAIMIQIETSRPCWGGLLALGYRLMTEKLEWDFPPTQRYHRRPRVEVMEPERTHRVAIRHHRRRQPPSFLPVFLVLVAVLLLCRYPFGFLMLAVLGGWPLLIALLITVTILVVAARREHRAGRPF
jgi:hypothetical protein